jgi:hypothetical protein
MRIIHTHTHITHREKKEERERDRERERERERSLFLHPQLTNNKINGDHRTQIFKKKSEMKKRNE